jgi:hypothetical protein
MRPAGEPRCGPGSAGAARRSLQARSPGTGIAISGGSRCPTYCWRVRRGVTSPGRATGGRARSAEAAPHLLGAGGAHACRAGTGLAHAGPHARHTARTRHGPGAPGSQGHPLCPPPGAPGPSRGMATRPESRQPPCELGSRGRRRVAGHRAARGMMPRPAPGRPASFRPAADSQVPWAPALCLTGRQAIAGRPADDHAARNPRGGRAGSESSTSTSPAGQHRPPD